MTNSEENPSADELPKEQEIEQEQKQEQEQEQDNRQALLTGIGLRLRQAREQRKISLDEVARELKLRMVHLSALEDGDWNALPGDIYGIGFIRQYAHFLDVDLEEDIARIKSGEYRLTKPLTFPDPPIAPTKRWAISAVLLFIILFIAFNVFHSTDRERKEFPTHTSTITPNSDLGSSKNKHETLPSRASAISGSSKPITTPKGISPTQSQAKPLPMTPSTSHHNDVKTTNHLASSTSAPSHNYSFEAVGGDVWLQLYNKQRQLLKEALLRNGQHMTIDSDAAYLIMDCGNAGAIRVGVDGKTLIAPGQLGTKGKVIRNFHLTPPA